MNSEINTGFGNVSFNILFDSEYPETADKELEAIIYNALIGHPKITKISGLKRIVLGKWI